MTGSKSLTETEVQLLLKEEFIKALYHDDAEEAYRLYTMTFSEYQYHNYKKDNISKKELVAPERENNGVNSMSGESSEGGSCLCSCLTGSKENENSALEDRTSIMTAALSDRRSSTNMAPPGRQLMERRSSDVISSDACTKYARSSNDKIFSKKLSNISEEMGSFLSFYEPGSDQGSNDNSKSKSFRSVGLLEETMHPNTSILIMSKKEVKYKRLNLKDVFKETKHMMMSKRLNLTDLNSFRGRNDISDVHVSDRSDTDSNAYGDDINVTTPLHEAARLGSIKLIDLMLKRNADVSAKNGMRRTVFHCICGGIIKMEENLLNSIHYCKRESLSKALPAHAGIRSEARQKRIEEIEENKSNSGISKTPFLPVFFNANTKKPTTEKGNEVVKEEVNELEWSYEKDRMSCLLKFLLHDSNTASINTVDRQGRTALHYASELGRADLCSAIVTDSEVMLTIIDDTGRTPCELAGINGHDILAAWLEARAVLMEDETYSENFGGDRNINPNVPPYCWFKSMTLDDVLVERDKRIEQTSDELEKFISHDLNIIVEAYKYMTHLDSIPDMSVVKFFESAAFFRKKIEEEPNRDNHNFFNHTQVAQILECFGWNPYLTLKKFKKNPAKVIEETGLILQHSSVKPTSDEASEQCPICLENIFELEEEGEEIFELEDCKHKLCKNCLLLYVESTVKDNLGVRITCPVENCRMIINEESLEAILGHDDVDKNGIGLQHNMEVLQALWRSESENFVSSAKDWRFCPMPNCSAVIQSCVNSKVIDTYDEESIANLPAVCILCPQEKNNKITSKDDFGTTCTYEGVPYPEHLLNTERLPPRASKFCFSCLKEPHWPASCEIIIQWKDRLAKERLEVTKGGEAKMDLTNSDEFAQQLWLKANTRPCPKCNAPIEKDEGCNHMTCTNRRCKHEFCWICRQPWRSHGIRTGGYYVCNKWQENENNTEINQAGNTAQGTAINARVASKLMARFLHFLTRYNAHLESKDLEQEMADNVCSRMKPVIEASQKLSPEDFNLSSSCISITTLWAGLSFIHAAFVELIQCRNILLNSYVYAYYRYRSSGDVKFTINAIQEKVTFESLQSELEMITEQLSDIVARKYIRATRSQIVFLTAAAAEKRLDFYQFVIKVARDEGKIYADQEERMEDLQTEGKANPPFRSLNRPGKEIVRIVREIFASECHEENNESKWNDEGNVQEENEMVEVEDALLAEAMEQSMKDAIDNWTCNLCTYENSRESDVCAICRCNRYSN